METYNQRQHDIRLQLSDIFLAKWVRYTYIESILPLLDLHKYYCRKNRFSYTLFNDDRFYEVFINRNEFFVILTRRIMNNFENTLSYICNLNFENESNIRENINILCDCDSDDEKIEANINAMKALCFRLYGV